MKSNSLSVIFGWLLATSLVLSMVFCLQFFFRSREMRRDQAEMQRYQGTHQVLNVLLGDLVEYSKRDANMLPILESVGVKMNKAAGASATAKPAAK
jgi:hypothetical protein